MITYLPFFRPTGAESPRHRLDQDLERVMHAFIDEVGRPCFLYLCPSKRKSRVVAAGLGMRKLSWKPSFLVSGELAELVAKELKHVPQKRATPEMKALLVFKILERSYEDGRLHALHFRDGLTPRGAARHVVYALEALARKGLTPEDDHSDIRSELAEDLGIVSRDCETVLTANGYVDTTRIPMIACEALRSGKSTIPGGPEVLILDGFVAPEKTEVDFLIEVVRSFQGKEVILTVPWELIEALGEGGWDNLPPHLRIYRHGRDFFQRLGLDEAIRSDPDADTGRGQRPVLFREDAAATADLSAVEGGKAVVATELRLFPINEGVPNLRRYSSRVEEVKGIAREIKKIFFNETRPGELNPEDFHVVVPRIDPYYRLFIELFPRYGIPFNITRGIPLSSIPVVGLIIALMDSVLIRDHTALYRLFFSEMVSVPPPDGATDFQSFMESHADSVGSILADSDALDEPVPAVLDITILDRVCREAGVPGGTDVTGDWIQPIARYFNARILSAGNADDPYREERLKADFREALVQFWLLSMELRLLDELSVRQSPQDAVAGIERLLDRYGVRKNLIRSLASLKIPVPAARRIVVEKNTKGFNRALEVLGEIARDLQITGVTECGLETVRDLFLDRCRREMIQEAGELAGVSISEMLEIRNLARPVVFMAGLTAGDFPATPSGSFILPQGPGTDSFTRAVDESRYILHEVLVNSGRVILSYPASDGQEPMEISPLLEDRVHLGELVVEEVNGPQGEPLCSYEILQAIGGAWDDGEPVPWDLVSQLVSRYPARSEASLGRFHDNVRRALCASLQQSRTDNPGPYDGMIPSGPALDAVCRMLDSPRFSYSVSMLNDYLRCPLSFFFKRILALQPVREIPEEPEAAEVGSAVHEILARFYESKVKAALGRIAPETRIAAMTSLYETAREVLDQSHVLAGDDPDVFAVRRRITNGLYDAEALTDQALLERVKSGSDIPRHKRGLLRLLVDHESDVDLPLYPWSLEWGYGYKQIPPLIIDTQGTSPIRIKGRIDRVDLYRTSKDGPGIAAWVFDYKTGKCPTMTDVRAGKDLQLQVYLLAILNIVKEMGIDQAGACFLSLRTNEKYPRKDVIFTEGSAPVAVAASKQSLWQLSDADLEGFRSSIREIDSSIRRGLFPRSRTAAPCGVCEYYNTCFRDENRMRMLHGNLLSQE